MKTKIEWEQNITKITDKIYQEFPELSKYISEMPTATIENDKISLKNLEDYYQSLEDIVNKYAKTHIAIKPSQNTSEPLFPGYPLYPASEDIYNHAKKEMDINPENISKNKTHNLTEELMIENEFKDDMSGYDLDVPGSELDDQQESVGSEDEENNYYSLGGDNHNDLDENNG